MFARKAEKAFADDRRVLSTVRFLRLGVPKRDAAPITRPESAGKQEKLFADPMGVFRNGACHDIVDPLPHLAQT
jgi:hypothetical protein